MPPFVLACRVEYLFVYLFIHGLYLLSCISTSEPMYSFSILDFLSLLVSSLLSFFLWLKQFGEGTSPIEGPELYISFFPLLEPELLRKWPLVLLRSFPPSPFSRAAAHLMLKCLCPLTRFRIEQFCLSHVHSNGFFTIPAMHCRSGVSSISFVSMPMRSQLRVYAVFQY